MARLSAEPSLRYVPRASQLIPTPVSPWTGSMMKTVASLGLCLFAAACTAGNPHVTVEGTIDGVLSGNGNIDVYGEPDGTIDELGSGVVNWITN